MNKLFKLFLISLSTISFGFAQDPLLERQWYLNNTGQIIYERISDQNQVSHIGKKDVDIDWVAPSELEHLVKKDIIVAVIDTGIDFSHPDFTDRIWDNPSCKDENPLMCKGKNFINLKAPAIDDKGHGTHVAGIIVANKNTLGIRGITSPHIKIMPLKVIDKKSSSYFEKRRKMLAADIFAEAIEYAVANKADVINLSFGFPKLALTERFIKAINTAYKNTIPVVVAAGNNNKSIPVYPCSLDNVICVGSIDNQGNISKFSNFGHKVDILAPGESIVSTYPVSIESRTLRKVGNEIKNGTSQAAPIISAIIASLKSILPNITIDEINARLINSTSHHAPQESKTSLSGSINMRKVLFNKTTQLIKPSVKNLDKVIVNQDNSFEFELAFKRFVKEDKTTAHVSLESVSGIVYDNLDFTINNFNDQNLATINITGKITSESTDNNLPVIFTTKYGESQVSRSRLNLLLTKNLTDLNLKKYVFKEAKLKNALRVGKRKTSFISEIKSAFNKTLEPQFFYQYKNNKKEIMIDILGVKEGNSFQKTLTLKKDINIKKILRGDFNLDKKSDYLILYEQNIEGKLSEVLFFLNEDLIPLYGDHSKWVYDRATNFTLRGDVSLISFDKNLVSTHWVKYSDSTFKNILVPLTKNTGLIPKEDNSMDLLEHQMARPTERYYYFQPLACEEKVCLSPRILNNYFAQKKLNKIIKTKYFSRIRTELISTTKSSDQGVVNMFVSTGEEFQKDIYEIEFIDTTTFKYVDKKSDNYNFLSKNINLAVINNKNFTGRFYFNLFDYSRGLLSYFDEAGKIVMQTIKSDGRKDPFFGFITGLKNNESVVSMMESRYWIHAYRNNSVKDKIAINRESSFPGVQFSETMEGVILKVKDQIEPGVFVNSTLLHGEQIYSAVLVGNKLKRPVNLTVTIPKNCVYQSPSTIMDTSRISAYVFSCIENNELVMNFVPLIVN